MSHHDHDPEHGHECTHDHEPEEEFDDDFPEPTDEEVYGPQVPAEPIFLQAGPVSVQFDTEWGILRRFRVGGRDALRAIYPAVRSSQWRTARPRISGLKVETTDDSFRLTFDCEHVDAETGVDFAWRGELTGTADGTVSYGLEGAARAAMRTNRTGLCVLHPILPTAGRPVTVTHGDGRAETTEFPSLISPHQPFFDVAALAHEVAPGVVARVAFEGDVFETEDQRNWTDASFKTYGGALAQPLPLSLAAGQHVRQRVTFTLEARGPLPAGPVEEPPVRVTLPAAGTVPLPSVGTRVAPDSGEPATALAEPLRTLGLGHVLVDVDLTVDGWSDRLAGGRRWADALDARVLVRLIFTPNHQPSLAAFAADWADAPGRLLAVAVVCPGEPCPGAVTLGLVADAVARVAPFVPVAAAPAENFADMNRFRPPPAFWAAPPMCPQVHSFDHESMMENLEAQPALLATARSFNPHPLLVGPVALLRRRVPDPRQGSLFAAAWTAGSLAAVLPRGLAAAVTYHEHAGPMGIPGTPCAGVLEGLAGATLTAPTTVSDPSAVAALTVFAADGARRVLLANLTRWTVEISLGEDEESAFEFGPYATAWLDA
jgi:hypothetical protein